MSLRVWRWFWYHVRSHNFRRTHQQWHPKKVAKSNRRNSDPLSSSRRYHPYSRRWRSMMDAAATNLVGLRDIDPTIIFGLTWFIINYSNELHFWQDNDLLTLQPLLELTLLRIPTKPMILHRWFHLFQFHSLIFIIVVKFFVRKCQSQSFHFYSPSAYPVSFWPYNFRWSWFGTSSSQSKHHPDTIQDSVIAWHSRYCFESAFFVELSRYPIIIEDYWKVLSSSHSKSSSLSLVFVRL